VPDSTHAGDVLASRYRLDDLLAESEGGRFWRAHDAVLHRHVAVHLLEVGDARADGLLEAARTTAPYSDRRMLRVLDADRVDDVCYVVNEWGEGTSLDKMLAGESPLPPRQAAWIVAEVADSVARAHAAGLAHGRMVPENVLIDHNGQVRIIGFAVDAALHGLPPGRTSADVVDLAALLYAALTGKWPGVSSSAVPPAPHDHGHVLRPRKVRAGIPRSLDALCDEVINPYGTHHARAVHDLATARGISDALREFVGDHGGMGPTGPADVPRASGPASPWSATTVVPAVGDADDVDEASVVDAPVADAPQPEAPEVPEAAPPAAGPTPSTDLPTQAGMPVFRDDEDEVDWLRARADKPEPPPPFEETPPKPLFAPDPPEGQPVRRAREGARTSSGYWPWEGTGAGVTTGSGTWPPYDDDSGTGTGTGEREVPGRSWIRLAMVIAIGALLLVAGAAAYQLGLVRSEEAPADDAPQARPTGSASPTPFTDLSADDFDPQGSPPQDENPDLVPLVLDGDEATSWRTSSYLQNFGPGGLKTGVGLVVDLGATKGVREVDVATLGGPTSVSIYVGGRPPTGVADLSPVGDAAGTGVLEVPLDEAVSGRYVTVWLTSLPEVDGEFRGTISEISVRG
jgi:hypothetical protein